MISFEESVRGEQVLLSKRKLRHVWISKKQNIQEWLWFTRVHTPSRRQQQIDGNQHSKRKD